MRFPCPRPGVSSPTCSSTRPPADGWARGGSASRSVCLRLGRGWSDSCVTRRRVGDGSFTPPRPENGQLLGDQVGTGRRGRPVEFLGGAHGQGVVVIELERDAVRHSEGGVVGGSKSLVANELAGSLGHCQTQSCDFHDGFHLGPSAEEMRVRVRPGGFEFSVDRHQVPSARGFLWTMLYVDADATTCHGDGNKVAAVRGRAFQPGARQFGTTPSILHEGHLGAVQAQVASCEHPQRSMADDETSTVYGAAECGCSVQLLPRQQRAQGPLGP